MVFAPSVCVLRLRGSLTWRQHHRLHHPALSALDNAGKAGPWFCCAKPHPLPLPPGFEVEKFQPLQASGVGGLYLILLFGKHRIAVKMRQMTRPHSHNLGTKFGALCRRRPVDYDDMMKLGAW